MSRDTINLTDELTAYIRRVGVREDADLAALREETAHHRMATMQIGPEQGAFMALLVDGEKKLRIDTSDEIIKAALLTLDGAVVNPALAPAPSAPEPAAVPNG